MALFSQVNSYATFFIVYGILAAMAYSTTTLMTNSVLISKWFQEKKGLALGISITGFPLGPLVFAPLIGWLILQTDWRTTVLILGLGLVLVLMPLVILFVKDQDEEARKKAAASGEKLGPKVTFRALLANSQYVKLAGAYFGCGFTMALVATHFPIHAIDLGLSELVSASAFGLMGGFAVVGTISAGALSDKFGRKRLLSIVYLTRMTALLFFAFAANPAILYIGAVIFGLGWTATGPLTTALTGDIWGTKIMGTVFGYVFVLHQFGAAAGSYLGGFLFDYFQSYQLVFLLGALILLISATKSYLIDEKERQELPQEIVVSTGSTGK
jgi:MFS family permease